MKLAEFVKFLREDIQMFIEEYTDAHKTMPHTYPEDLDMKDWMKKFKLYAGLGC